MTITGKLGAGGNERATLAVPVPGQPKGQGAILPHRPPEETQPPFVMDLKRPDKVRFEQEFNSRERPACRLEGDEHAELLVAHHDRRGAHC